jgi:hypothetical protein
MPGEELTIKEPAQGLQIATAVSFEYWSVGNDL